MFWVMSVSASLNTAVRAYAVDGDEAARLWKLSAELTGVDAFAAVR